MTASPRRRLVCFPGAGMDAGAYRRWTPLLPEDWELITPTLPGKRIRLDETPLATVEEMAAEILSQIAGSPARTAFFGFSLGALVAYEAAVSADAHQAPEHLFLAGSRAPDRPTAELGIGHLPDAEFREAVSRLSAETRLAFADDALAQLLLEPMRADFAAAEEYSAVPWPEVQLPVSVLYGLQDPVAPEPEVLRWSRFTHGPFRSSAVPGDHNFPFDQPESVVDTIRTAWRTVNTDNQQTGIARSAVRDAWARVLAHDSFGEEDDFFAIGGNSLLAARVAAEISKRTGGVRVPLKAFFAAPTVSGLSAVVADRLSAQEAAR
ncbi:alpha/beta fold hydrolase [Streptomyces sp. IBSBF 2953]|nr:alpha/beta fold hydrolase [Streptomyces hayashii]